MVTASAAETAPGLHSPHHHHPPPAPRAGLQPGLPEASPPCWDPSPRLASPSHAPRASQARCPCPRACPACPAPPQPLSQRPPPACCAARLPGAGRAPSFGPGPPPQGAPLAQVLCGPGCSLPRVSAQPVSDCPSLSSCSFEDTPLSPSFAAPVLSVRPGWAFQTILSPTPCTAHQLPAPLCLLCQPLVGSDLLSCFSVSAPLLCR